MKLAAGICLFVGIIALIIGGWAYIDSLGAETDSFLGLIWSPDSEYVVFGVADESGAQYYSLNAHNGDVQDLFTLDTRIRSDDALDDYWRSTAWTADSRHIVAEPVDEDILLVDVVDGDVTQLTDDRYDEKAVAVSPDRKFVAYWHSQWGTTDVPNYSLHILEFSTNQNIVVDHALASPPNLAWSPDSTQFAYWVINDYEQPWELKVYDLTTETSRILLSDETLSGARELSWSPDNAYLTYWTYVSDAWGSIDGSDSDLYLVDLESGESQLVVDDLTFYYESNRTPIYWSPDGSAFAFATRGSEERFFVVNAQDGSVENYHLWTDASLYDNQHYVINITWQDDDLLVTREDGQQYLISDGDAQFTTEVDPMRFTSPDSALTIRVSCGDQYDPILLPVKVDDGHRMLACVDFELQLVNANGDEITRLRASDLPSTTRTIMRIFLLGGIGLTVIGIIILFVLRRRESLPHTPPPH